MDNGLEGNGAYSTVYCPDILAFIPGQRGHSTQRNRGYEIRWVRGSIEWLIG